MMKFLRFPLALGALTLAGCTLVESRPDPSRFYVLEATPAARTPESEPAAAPAWTPAIAVARVRVPAFLDQPQIVTRIEGPRVTFSEFHRWLEPVDKGATRIFTDELASRLGTDRVAMEPALDVYHDGVLVMVNLVRFDGKLGGEVVLEARYRASAVYDGNTLLVGDITLTETCGGEDYADYAAALSRLVNRLADEVAGRIRAEVAPNDKGQPVRSPAR